VSAAPDWRTSSRITTWSSPCAGLRPTDWTRGKQVVERGYEGYVAKDEAACTRAARRGAG
jgi:hypothetical protein